jgi:hypothetical protein
LVNENFTKNDIRWGVQIGHSSQNQGFQEFWGDEYNWNSLSTLMWKLVDVPNLRVSPPKAGDLYAEASWWNAALHLLAYGMGWTNIGQGLRAWRLDGYPLSNHVLRTVYHTWGPSIEGLEIWLNQSGLITGDLVKLTDGKHQPRAVDTDELTGQIFRFRECLNSGPRHELANRFFGGDYDQLHLSMHFPSSIGESAFRAEDQDPGWHYEDGHASVILLKLPGWHQTVVDGLRLFYGDAMANVTIEVSLYSFGTLGKFQYSPETGRLYRVLVGFKQFGSDFEYHKAGN